MGTEKRGLARFCDESRIAKLYSQLNKLYQLTGVRLTRNDLDDIINEAYDNQTLSYYIYHPKYNKFFSHKGDGTPINADNANYIEFNTGLTDESGLPIYGYLYRSNNPHNMVHKFSGLYWGAHIIDMFADYNLGGQLIFSKRADARRFFTELKKRVIDENWGISEKPSDLPYPILGSYIIHILKKINTNEKDKLMYNRERTNVLFNTNLFDAKFNEVYIAGSVDNNGNIRDPHIVSNIEELRSVGFSIEKYHIERTVPLVEGPTFYKDIDDIVYQKSWAIKQDDNLDHVIERCKERIESDIYKDMPTVAWSMMLKNAINFATKVAKSNYKFIVPQFRFIDEADYWERDKGDRSQLLMPIYLNCDISKAPDGVLILDIEKGKDGKPGTYCPKTILTIDQVYKNARLIAKPSEEWLSIK